MSHEHPDYLEKITSVSNVDQVTTRTKQESAASKSSNTLTMSAVSSEVSKYKDWNSPLSNKTWLLRSVNDNYSLKLHDLHP